MTSILPGACNQDLIQCCQILFPKGAHGIEKRCYLKKSDGTQIFKRCRRHENTAQKFYDVLE